MKSFLGVLVLLDCLGATATPVPCTPVPRRDEIAQRKFAEDLKACRGKNYDIVLLGDSVTEFWGMTKPNLKVDGTSDGWINMGVGGDRTQHLLWRLENGALDGYTTKFFALMIGVNNFFQPAIDENKPCDKAEEVAAAIRLMLDRILAKHPESKVLLLPILPYGFDSRYFKALEVRRHIDAVNDRIIDFVDDRRVFWIELRGAFLNADGTCRADCYKAGRYDAVGHYLHPGNGAYEKIITPAIRSAMLNGVAAPSVAPARAEIASRKKREAEALARSKGWTAAPLSADGREIRTNGTLVCAYALKDCAVRGVPFVGVRGKIDNGKISWPFALDSGSPVPADVAKGGYADLLTHCWWILAGEYKVTLKDLEPGSTYLVQIIGHRGITEYNRGHVWIKGTYRDAIHMKVGGAGWPCGGTLVGTFTADKTGTMEITVCTDDTAAVNAIQLRKLHEMKGDCYGL